MDPMDSELRRILRAPGGHADVDAVLADLHATAGRRLPRTVALLAVAAAVIVLVTMTALLSRPDDDRVVPSGPATSDVPSETPSPTPSSAPSDDLPTPPVNLSTEPWSGRTDYLEWTPPPDEVREVARPCRSEDIKVTNERPSKNGDGDFGTYTEALNTGTARCTLDGYPGLTAISGGGSTDLRPGRATFFLSEAGRFDFPVPATIDPGEAAVTIIRSKTCTEGETGRSTFSVVLPDGAATPVDTHERSLCRLSVEPWARFLPHVEAPDRYPGLQSSFELPTSVRPGGVLEYVATIENVGDATVDLGECPGYRQEVRVGSTNRKIVDGTWRLSCDRHPLIPPGASRSYTIRMRLPEDIKRSEEVRLIWGLVDLSPDSAAQGFFAVR